MPFNFRFLELSDAAVFQALRLKGLRASPDAFGSTYEAECGRSLDEIAQRIALNADGRGVLGAFAEDGALAGMIAFDRDGAPRGRHKGYLWGMYVDPEFRRQGLARALLNRIVDHARSIPELRSIRLGVTSVNPEAQALYASAGFEVYGVEPDAMSAPHGFIDEVFMILKIQR